MQGLISVIIPVYNIEPYLSFCLESIITQTYSNLEIILIDDGSDDGSGELCDQWKKKDPRIMVIHQNNKGPSEARNKGLALCTGQMIGFVDGDDWCEPEMFEIMASRMTATQADVVCCGFYDHIHGDDKYVLKGVTAIQDSSFENAVIPIWRKNGYFTVVWNKLFSRKVVFNPNLLKFDPQLFYGEDELWLAGILKRSDLINFIPHPLYHWRKREGSATRHAELKEYQLTHMWSCLRTMELLPCDNRIQHLLKGRMFNDCYDLKIKAYCQQKKDEYNMICETLKPMRKDWLFSTDVTLPRKIKVFIVGTLIRFGLSKKLIIKISQIKKRVGING